MNPQYRLKSILTAFLGLFGAVGIYAFGSGFIPSWISYGTEVLKTGEIVKPANALELNRKIKAPELDGGREWLNIDRPLRLEQLRGKVVLLDFWTYCCINCMHVLPDLKKLEHQYAKELVVIGVHSAKFQNEQETENIRQAILRYEITHPVVNDADFVIWRKYGARGWPNLVVIDPEGYIVQAVSGEGQYEFLKEIISILVERYKNTLNTEVIPLSLEKDKKPSTQLSFPGKILADEKSKRLFIADSNHNRIVIAQLDGKVSAIAGKGTMGLHDGSFSEAEFNHPQGMVFVNEFLYVADTENHALRRLDLRKQTVETVAGTGVQSHSRFGGAARKTGLNSPWDLACRDNDHSIYIAMAGPHQIWIYDPDAESVKPFAGSGREDIIDGALNACALAQPSGITSDGIHLYFADSEVSALRMVDFSGGYILVKTLIGTGLFNFGDQDGAFETALLQHPLGTAFHAGKVYLADTYNHKIKVADLKTQTIATFAGTGKPGLGTREAPQFFEPGGLSFAGEKIYVADTNNHTIRVIDLATRQTDTLQLDFSEWNPQNLNPKFDFLESGNRLSLVNQPLPAEGKLKVELDFPQGYHLNPLSKPIVQLRVTSPDGSQWVGKKFTPTYEDNFLIFDLSSGAVASPQKLEAALTFYYCRDDNQGQCLIGSLLIEGSLSAGKDTVPLKYTIGI